MSGEFRTFATSVRKIARQVVERHSPPIARYRVVAKKPLTLEDLGSDDRLIEGDDDLDVGRGLRQKMKVDDTVLVETDTHGDKLVVGIVSPYVAATEAGGGGGEGGEPEGGGADEAEEAEEAEAPKKASEAKEAAETAAGAAEGAAEAATAAGEGVGAVTALLASSGVGIVQGTGPRAAGFAHTVFVSPAIEEPVGAQNLDLWIKPE